MEENLDLIKEELNDEPKEGKNYRVKRVVTLDSIEVEKEVEVGVDQKFRRIDLIYNANKIIFIASIIFAIYGFIAIFGLADKVKDDEESTSLFLLICAASISLTFVFSAFSFFLGSLARFKIIRELHYINRSKYTTSYTIFMIVEFILKCLMLKLKETSLQILIVVQLQED